MFFVAPDPVFEVRRVGDHKRWRLVCAEQAGGAIQNVILEHTTKSACLAALRARNQFEKRSRAFDLDKSVKVAGPHGTLMSLDGCYLTALDIDGKTCAQMGVSRLDWLEAMTLGCAQGALTCTSIVVVDSMRGSGIATAMHDLFAQTYAIPTVPNLAHGVRGSLSELAQGFWAYRAANRVVPGLSDGLIDPAFARRAIFEQARARWLEESRFDVGSKGSGCLAFAMALSERTGWPVVEVMTSVPGQIGWAVQAPDGRKVTAGGIWNPGNSVKDIDNKDCVDRGPVDKVQLDLMAHAWSIDKEQSDAAGLLVHRILCEAGYAVPDKAMVNTAHQGEIERFRRLLPILATALLDGVMPPKPMPAIPRIDMDTGQALNRQEMTAG